MSSTRLPGKIMLPLAGEPLIYRMIERLKKTKKIDLIVVATSKNPEDKIIKDITEQLNVEFFRGSLNDVRDRYYKASKKYEAEYILRIPADNPIPDHFEIDKLVDFHLEQNPKGFSSNLAQVKNSKYLDGIGAEIFSHRLLEEAINKFDNQIVKEHVHRNFFDYSTQSGVNEEWCPIKSPKAPDGLNRPDIVLDVNTRDDYVKINDIYTNLYPTNPEFSTLEVINFLDRKKSGI
jgi:spore coat polysaccharide biosynthesis protein SpsF (cytidylyltransferase family)